MWDPRTIFAKRDAFAAWANPSSEGSDIRSLLIWTIVLDVPFIAGYTGLLGGLSRRWHLHLAALISLAVAADVAEDAVSLWAIAQLPTQPPAAYDSSAPTVLTWASLAKWVLLAGTVAVGGYRLIRRRSRRPSSRASRSG